LEQETVDVTSDCFALFVYPVKLTKAMLEICMREVPGEVPLSPLSSEMAGPESAPRTLKFEKRMLLTEPHPPPRGRPALS
jgi:hypothetical protein